MALWYIINYFSLAFSFVIFPLFQGYHLSGYETFRDKVLYVVLDNLKSKIKFLVIGVIAIAILFAIYQENIIKETTNLFKIVRIYLNFFNLLKFYFNASYGVFQSFFDFLIYFRCDLMYVHIFYNWKIKEISNQYLECKVKLVNNMKVVLLYEWEKKVFEAYSKDIKIYENNEKEMEQIKSNVKKYNTNNNSNNNLISNQNNMY